MEKFIDEILIGKASVIQRCVARIREEYIGFENEFSVNFTKQDSIVLNLQRAAEAAIDAANHLVKTNQLGIPQTSRDAIEMLERAGIIDSSLGAQMRKMVGFRNIAVHDYTSLNLNIVRKIVETRLSDFETFASVLLVQGKK